MRLTGAKRKAYLRKQEKVIGELRDACLRLHSLRKSVGQEPFGFVVFLTPKRGSK